MAGSHVAPETKYVLQFSDKHGQNVRLANGNKSALFHQRCFDGKGFVTEPLSKGGHLRLELSRSGSFLLGLVYRRPTKSEVHDVENKLSANCVYLQQYVIHKQTTCTVSLSRETSREVKVKYGPGNDTETRTLDIKNGNIFVVFEILFGDLVMELKSDDGKNYKFDEVSGPSVRFPSRGCTTVDLQKAYGDALCSTSRAVGKRETIHLIFNPVDEAQWCHMTTYLSNTSPTVMDPHNMEKEPRSRMKFKMRGSVQLCLQDGGVPCYTFNGREKRVDVHDLDLRAPLFLYIQLFRVRVDLRSEPKPRPVTCGSSRYVRDCAEGDTGSTGRPKTKESFSDLIQSNYVYLKDFLEPDPLVDHLLGDRKMPPTKAEEFRELPNRMKKCDMVLHILMKDPSTEQTFKRAMEYPQYPQQHILTKLGLLERAIVYNREA